MHSHYAASAYHPERIPDQPNPAKRGWLKRFGSARLPWGRAQDIYPISMLRGSTPAELRAIEAYDEELASGKRKPQAYEQLDYHQVINHERYRHASLAKRSLFWFYLWGGGRFVFWVSAVLGPIAWVWLSLILDGSFAEHLLMFVEETSWYLAVPLACWTIGSFVVHKLPNWFVRPSKGPLWEFNRRTGLVTLFDYDNMGEYQRSGSIGEFVNPFHEFDAYISSGPDRQGLIWHQLYLAHRYHDLTINLSPIVMRDTNLQPQYAGWDFLQNYMDTSRPLPDIPLFEQYREQDPITAAHDRTTQRPARYWRDMDDASWDAKLDEACAWKPVPAG